MQNQNNVSHVTKEQGQTVSVVGDTYRIVVGGKQTGGAYAVIDMMVPPGGGPGPHSHAQIQESFHVLEGEVEVKSEAGTFVARAGDFVNIPLGGIVHCFHNRGAEVAHLWCVVMPAGMDEMFEEMGRPVSLGQFLPPPQMGPDEQKRLQAITEKYGQKLFPPNYFD